MGSNCLGCNWRDEIPSEYVICEDKEGFLVNHSIGPKVLGHIVVMLLKVKEHPTKDFQDQQRKKGFEVACEVANILPLAIQEVTEEKVERVYLVTFNESEEWHPHIHIIPISVSVPKDKLGSDIFRLSTLSHGLKNKQNIV